MRYIKPEALDSLLDDELDKYYKQNAGSANKGEFMIFIRCDVIVERMAADLKNRIENRLRDAAIRAEAAPEVKSMPFHFIWCQPIWRLSYDSDPPHQSDSLNSISPLNSDPQVQSSLFSKLSPELRYRIFRLVLAEYEDFTEEYRPEDENTEPDFCDYYRPGWTAPWRIDWAVLLSCRRVYYEASHLPMRLATHRFCFDLPKPRMGRHSESSKLGGVPISQLTMANLNNVTSIHIQTTRSWLQSSRKIHLSNWEMYRGPDPFPNLEYLTITIPWAHWFPFAPADFDLNEVQFDDWPEVKKRLRLEFEVVEWEEKSFVQDLDDLVDELRGGGLKMETINGTPLVPDTSGSPEKWRWSMLFPEGVKDYDYTEYRIGYNHPDPASLLVSTVDYIPGRARPYSELLSSGMFFRRNDI